MARLTAGKTYVRKPRNADLQKIAQHSLNEVVKALARIDELEAASDALNRRIRKGYRWLDENSTFHPKYARGMELVNELQVEQTQTRWMLRDARVILMGHSLTFWQAYDGLMPIEQQAIAAEHDLSRIERTDADMYRERLMNWQDMGQEVEVPW